MNKEVNVGLRIKNIRIEKNLLLKEVADRCGVSSSLLSQIEKGTANPSLNTIKSIAQALEVPIFNFFIETEGENYNVNILKKEDRKIITTKDIIYELISPENTKALECMKMIFPKKGAQTSVEPMAHKGEEVAVVIKGRVELYIGGNSVILGEGDSVQIPPITPHKWININDEESVVLFSVTPPEF